MPAPRVSIVLPTHNGSRYIEESIDSCLSQTYANWELIIVDDASTDDTPEKIHRYIDRRIRVIRHPGNRRLPAALNTGFSSARGEYLTWTSDDNVYRPTALEEMATFLHRHPNVDVVYTDYSVIDGAGSFIELVSVSGPEGLVHSNCVGPSFLYRRRVQEVLVGYSEDLFMAEDFDFWVRASIYFRLTPLHKDLYRYRRHEASLTSLYWDRVLPVMEKSLGRNLRKMHWVSSSIKSTVFMRLASGARDRGDRVGTTVYLLQSAFYNPPKVLQYGMGWLGRRGRATLSRFIRGADE